MDMFWNLLADSVITQSFLATACTSACVYLWVTGQPVPAELLHIEWAVIAFWMGSKTQLTLDRKS